jgi:hypothetical protein
MSKDSLSGLAMLSVEKVMIENITKCQDKQLINLPITQEGQWIFSII